MFMTLAHGFLISRLDRHFAGGFLSAAPAATPQQIPDLPSWVGNVWVNSCGAFALTLVIALMAARWVGPRGFMDQPGGRKQHKAPVPRIGGLALIISLALAGACGWLKDTLSPLVWMPLGAMALIGILDDRFDLRARWKAAGTFAIAILLALLGTLELTQLPAAVHLFGCNVSGMPLLLSALLLMLFWGIPQAFNLIDGANGLTLGYGLICLTVLTLAGTPVPYVLGAVTALFVLNWPRSRLFLGDCGSLCLGLLCAMLAFKAFGRTKPEAVLWLFAYPIADVVQVVIVRLATGSPLGEADRNHFHHRWKEALGARAYLRVPLIWLQAALCASGTLLTGSWRIIPWIGLAWLSVQTTVFMVSSIRRHQRAKAVCSQPRSQRNDTRLHVDLEADPRHSSVGN